MVTSIRRNVMKEETIWKGIRGDQTPAQRPAQEEQQWTAALKRQN